MILSGLMYAAAQDWSQWRGSNRDSKVSGFTAPKTWPKELAQKWKVTVGQGDATPALVGDKLYVFARQEGGEITRCLDAATGKELWQDKYDALGATGPASGHAGPRSSPAVVSGKVVTLGVRGVLSCLDAATGKMLWRKDDFQGAWPQFFTASSPIIVDGLCIAELGGPGNGGIAAYDLGTGEQKWKWTDDAPAYASPMLLTLGGTKLVVAQTAKKMVALGAADGKLAWEKPFATRYNASTPIVDGQTIIYGGSGQGFKAVKLTKEADGFVAKELWSNADKSVLYNTPVLKNGLLFGLTEGNEFFCLNAQTGQTAWSAPAGPADAAGGGGGGGGRGRGGGRGGYGSIIDAGSVLLALTPSSQLIAYEPSDKQYTELARIKVADTQTYAQPVVSGKRIFIKDQDSVTLWTID
jgi:outer membrane protein assembly factor BamB